MSRVIAAAAALAALAASAPAQAQATREIVTPPPPVAVVRARVERADAAELAEARAIIAIMFPPAQREETFRALVGQIIDQLTASFALDTIEDPGLRAIFDRFLQAAPGRLMPTVNAYLPRLFEATAVAYTHEFDLAELRDIHAFARTPAGAHYLSRSAALIGDPAVAEANAGYFADIQVIAEVARKELQAEIAEYLTAHPEVAERVAGQRGD